MSNPAIMSAISEHFMDISGLPPVVWPNQEITLQPPFIIWDDGFNRVEPITIDGEERFEYRPQVSLMVELGTHTSASDTVLWSIAQAFKFGTKIASPSGEYIAYCPSTPVASNGRADGALFRTDMELRIFSSITV